MASIREIRNAAGDRLKNLSLELDHLVNKFRYTWTDAEPDIKAIAEVMFQMDRVMEKLERAEKAEVENQETLVAILDQLVEKPQESTALTLEQLDEATRELSEA